MSSSRFCKKCILLRQRYPSHYSIPRNTVNRIVCVHRKQETAAHINRVNSEMCPCKLHYSTAFTYTLYHYALTLKCLSINLAIACKAFNSHKTMSLWHPIRNEVKTLVGEETRMCRLKINVLS